MISALGLFKRNKVKTKNKFTLNWQYIREVFPVLFYYTEKLPDVGKKFICRSDIKKTI